MEEKELNEKVGTLIEDCSTKEVKELDNSCTNFIEENRRLLKKKYLCERCGKEHGRTNQRLKCTTCHLPFCSAQEKRKHQCSREEKEKLECSSCGKTFATKGILTTHIVKRICSQPAVPCEVCGKLFLTKSLLNKHKIAHTTEKPFPCDICGKCFAKKNRLKAHLETHSKVKSFQCEICAKKFALLGTLKRHQMQVHFRKNLPYPCTLCGRSFAHEYMLKNHLPRHNGIYECPYCELFCYSRKDLKIHHFEIHPHLNRFCCTVCERTFSRKNGLDSHKCLTFPEGGKQRFPCLQCQKIFSRRSFIKNHKCEGQKTDIKNEKYQINRFKNYLSVNNLQKTNNVTENAENIKVEIEISNEDFLKKSNTGEIYFALHQDVEVSEIKKDESNENIVQIKQEIGNNETVLPANDEISEKSELKLDHCSDDDRISNGWSDDDSSQVKTQVFNPKLQKSKEVSEICRKNNLKRTKTIICNKCGFKFGDKCGRLKHCCKKEKLFCKICGNQFLTEKSLSTHLEKKICVKKSEHMPCEICGKVFEMKNLLRKHMVVHSSDKPFACDKCGKTFALKNRLKAHLITHLGTRPFSCEICAKRFALMGTLKRHQIQIHNKDEGTFICIICSKSFSRESMLKLHNSRHSGERPFQCELCGKSFSQKSHFKQHYMACHEGARPFSCDICKGKFARKSTLEKHKCSLTLVSRPFPCLSCGKNFARSSYVKSHKCAKKMALNVEK